jgi:hypothetical protein
MTSIVKRLRDTGCDREPFTSEHADCKCRLANEAANEIERLRGELDKQFARANEATNIVNRRNAART